jgi:hypothetical protein
VTRLLACALAALGLSAFADQVTLEPLKDNTLIERVDGASSNGGGPVFAGRTTREPAGLSIRRAVIAFDVAGAIPPGATVTDVRLTMTMNKAPNSLSVPIRLHRAVADWGEGTSAFFGGKGAPSTPGDATWIHTFFDGQFWSAPGGDFVTVFSASGMVGGLGDYTWGSTPEMVSDVQSWLDNPAGNFGWVVIGDESASSTVKRFASREDATPGVRPALRIEFNLTSCDGCDTNCDGSVDAFDIEPFIDLLVNPNPSPCSACAGDANGDMVVDAFDIEPFINCLVGP